MWNVLLHPTTISARHDRSKLTAGIRNNFGNIGNCSNSAIGNTCVNLGNARANQTDTKIGFEDSYSLSPTLALTI